MFCKAVDRTYLPTFGILLFVLSLTVGCGREEATPQPDPTPTPMAAASAAESLSAGERRFVIVPEESTAAYIVTEEFFAGALAKLGIEAGIQEVTGSTQALNGELVLRLEEGANELVAAAVTVDLSTLTTTRNQRDEWIRENALESNKFPQAQFVATGLEDAPATYTEGEEVAFQLLGDLTVREITQPVTFDVTATLSGDTINAVATTAMQLTDFGFDPPSFANTLTVADDFVIRIDLTARE